MVEMPIGVCSASGTLFPTAPAAGLGRDDGGHAVRDEPVSQPEDLLADLGRALQVIEQHVQAIEHDARRSRPSRALAEHREEAHEIEVAALDDRFREPAIEEVDAPARRQLAEPPVEGRGVGQDLFRALLERDEQAWLAPYPRPVCEELEAEDRLATARVADDDRHPAAGQPTAGDLVEPGDPRRRPRVAQPCSRVGVRRAHPQKRGRPPLACHVAGFLGDA